MKRRISIAIVLGLLTPPALAGEATLTEAGARNVGSSAAYLALCEMQGYVPIGTLADFMAELKGGLGEAYWNRVKSQYQTSLHEKKQYSIAKDKWLPFNISTAPCQDLLKAVPVITAVVKRNAGVGK